MFIITKLGETLAEVGGIGFWKVLWLLLF